MIQELVPLQIEEERKTGENDWKQNQGTNPLLQKIQELVGTKKRHENNFLEIKIQAKMIKNKNKPTKELKSFRREKNKKRKENHWGK